MQNPLLVQIKTEDSLILPGTLFEARSSKKAAIHIHGNGSSSVFYTRNQRPEQVEALNKNEISFLLFNNRGAQYIHKLDVKKNGEVERKRFGMAYELIKDCVKDIDAAIKFLKELGYREFYLVGESTGANKICVYHYYKPKNEISKYVMIGGGDDTGTYYDILGKEKFFKLLETAKEKIKKGRGAEIICEILPDNIFSYQGFYDIANPDGDYNTFPFLEVIENLKLSTKPLFRHYKSIDKPPLAIYGEDDEYAWENASKMVEILKKQKPEFNYQVIKGVDHSLSGQHKQVAKLIADWLKNE